MSSFIDNMSNVLKAGQHVTTNMFSNTIKVDDVTYQLENVELQSNWSLIKYEILEVKSLGYSLSGSKDKVTKQQYTDRVSYICKGGAGLFSISFEINNNAKFMEMV